MKQQIVRITPSRKEALREAKAINNSLKKRMIKRKAFVCSVSQSYVKKLTREGYPISKKNYGICMKDVK